MVPTVKLAALIAVPPGVETVIGPVVAPVGTVVETSRGKYVVKLGEETETFTKPNHKDVDVQIVLNLRRMLKGAGYDATSE